MGDEYFYVKDGLTRFYDVQMVFVLSLDFKNDILYGTKILPILSDPTSEDGDGDGYTDGAIDKFCNGKINDPRPLLIDVFEYSLSNPDFLAIHNKLNDDNYGGTQNWWEDDNGINKDKVINNGGCGLIAACNVFAYLELTHPELDGLTGIPDVNNIYQDDFINFVNEAYNYLTPSNMCDALSGGAGTWGISSNNYFKGFNSYISSFNLSNNEIILLSYDTYGEYPIEIIMEGIKNCLRNDIPVVILVGGMRKNYIPYYDYDLNKYDSMSAPHYVTITGMNIDKISGESNLIVSSWGRKLEFSLYAWYENDVSDLLDQIFYIVIKG
jgi:hypothetical protein